MPFQDHIVLVDEDGLIEIVARIRRVIASTCPSGCCFALRSYGRQIRGIRPFHPYLELVTPGNIGNPRKTPNYLILLHLFLIRKNRGQIATEKSLESHSWLSAKVRLLVRNLDRQMALCDHQKGRQRNWRAWTACYGR